MPFASGAPPLPISVAHVLLMGAEKQVRRIYAWRVVAAVTDQKFVGNDSSEHFERKTMRQNRAPGVMRLSIAHAIQPAGPDPTFALCPNSYPSKKTRCSGSSGHFALMEVSRVLQTAPSFSRSVMRGESQTFNSFGSRFVVMMVFRRAA